ncbi:MAG: hypothetical protein PUG38_09670 [Sutterellaceae bacterium]|nr:hypothetical protein [Sutterellaceae bacterium]MDY2867528.1 hypothetical protein [Mesosutterella sp.]
MTAEDAKASNAIPNYDPWERLEDRSVLERWPAGSIRTHEEAQAALDDIDARRRKLDEAAAAQHDACIDNFLVSACWEKVRRLQFDRGREFRQVELEAKDFIRAENTKKEKERQVAAKIESGADVSDDEIEKALADRTPTKSESDAASRVKSRLDAEARVEKARADAAEKQSNELANQAKYDKRQADLSERRAKEDERHAEALKRVADHDKTVARVSERQAEALAKQAEEAKNLAATQERERQAAERKERATERAAELEKKRAERAATLEADREKRRQVQEAYEKEKARRENSINPFN